MFVLSVLTDSVFFSCRLHPVWFVFLPTRLIPIFRVQFHTCAILHWSFTLTKAQLDDTKDKDERFPPGCTVTFNFDKNRTPPDDSDDNFGAALAHAYSTVERLVLGIKLPTCLKYIGPPEIS